MRDAPHAGDNRSGTARGAHGVVRPQREDTRVGPLSEIGEELRVGLEVRTELAHRLHDADDLPHDAVHTDALADGALAGELAAGKHVVDDHDARRASSVLVAEAASRRDANTHRVEIVATDQPTIGPAPAQLRHL